MRMNRINRIVLSTIAFLALQANAGETVVEKRTSAAPRFTVEEAGTSFINQVGAERSYTLEIAANQVIFSGGRVPGQISSASFQRDSSYYSFRNTIDLIVAAVRQQFYLILLDRALIGVQEESVRLLQSQLQDQQN